MPSRCWRCWSARRCTRWRTSRVAASRGTSRACCLTGAARGSRARRGRLRRSSRRSSARARSPRPRCSACSTWGSATRLSCRPRTPTSRQMSCATPARASCGSARSWRASAAWRSWRDVRGDAARPRRPCLGPRFEPPGHSRRVRASRLSRARRGRRGRPGAGAGARARAAAPRARDLAEPEGLRRPSRVRRGAPAFARRAPGRSRVPRGLHADPDARPRPRVRRTDRERPPLTPARVPRPRRPAPGARARRQGRRRHRALRRRGCGHRADNSTGERARAPRRHGGILVRPHPCGGAPPVSRSHSPLRRRAAHDRGAQGAHSMKVRRALVSVHDKTGVVEFAGSLAALGVETDPPQYPRVLDELRANGGALSEATRARLAQEAFRRTAEYDAAIASYLSSEGVSTAPSETAPRIDSAGGAGARTEKFPAVLRIDAERRLGLRYGENPHQAAAFYTPLDGPRLGLAAMTQLHGPELGYNNALDFSPALA